MKAKVSDKLKVPKASESYRKFSQKSSIHAMEVHEKTMALDLEIQFLQEKHRMEMEILQLQKAK